MSNIQHDKTKQKSFANYTIKHKQEVPEQVKNKERLDIVDQTKVWLKKKGNKIKQIADGVSGYQEMSRKEVNTKKGKIRISQAKATELSCKGCTEHLGKPVMHNKSEFCRTSTNRGYVLTCRADKLRKAKIAALKRRLS